MKRRSNLLSLLCLAGLLTPLLTRTLTGSDHSLAWLVDLASHWQWLFLGGLVVFGALAAHQGKLWMLMFLGAPLPWFTALAQAPVETSRETVVSVASANVGLGSREPGVLATWLAAQQIDLVALCEVSPAYAQALQSLPGFPHRHVAPRHGPFGLALLSRHPLVGPEVIEDSDGIPRIRVTVLLGQRPITVTAVHPMPPIAAEYHWSRNEQLRLAAKESGRHRQPAILLGDLNASPWSSGLIGPADEGFRRATGLSPSWPAALKGLLGIPIDQILVTDHWMVTASGTGPQIGSDHLPVWARLALRNEGASDAGS
jgi:endonuclease/exonuclease/phosphatase (EEP) superfamily protein YafD